MLILVVGFAARVSLALALGINAPPPGSDSTEYDAAAWNLAQGRGYRATMNEISDEERATAFRLPGTSLVWASVYAVFGHRYSAVRVLQCLAGAATSLIVFGIGRRCFGERIGWIAAMTYMLWPHALLMSSYLQAEVLGTLWFLWFILAGLWFAERPNWGRACGGGVLLGAVAISRADVQGGSGAGNSGGGAAPLGAMDSA
jgi:hypothetical protein